MTDSPGASRPFRWNGEWRDITPSGGQVIELAPNQYVIDAEHRQFEVFLLPDGTVSDGQALDGVELVPETERDRIIRERFQVRKQAGTNQAAEHVIKAPMPGLVRAVKVTVGDEVDRTTTVLVLEAMKMENNILAGAKGRVRHILVEEGSSVDKNAKLIELEAA